MKKADMALYDVKLRGRDGVGLFRLVDLKNNNQYRFLIFQRAFTLSHATPKGELWNRLPSPGNKDYFC